MPCTFLEKCRYFLGIFASFFRILETFLFPEKWKQPISPKHCKTLHERGILNASVVMTTSFFMLLDLGLLTMKEAIFHVEVWYTFTKMSLFGTENMLSK
jgi:hypothetical protein